MFGPDRVETLGQLAGEMGARRAMVVTDPGIVQAGHAQRGVDALTRAGIDVVVFDNVQENPTTRHVELGVAVARRHEPELLVGLGGGSAMDCAKGINFVYSNGGTMRDYWGVGKALKEMLPMIAVPTTAGTGSETQSFALISDDKTHVKMACGDKKASCRIAILDPTLTVTQPERITALTGIDAIAHAVETYVTNKKNPVSLAFSREAWRLLAQNFVRVLQEPANLDARGGMQLGACFAGLAIENSMLGAAHALANPLTASYGVAHGQAVGMMLPHVVRYNSVEFNACYGELLEVTAGLPGCPDPQAGGEGLAEFLNWLLTQANLATSLSDCQVSRDTLPQLAQKAAEQWTAGFNPRTVNQDALQDMYEQAF